MAKQRMKPTTETCHSRAGGNPDRQVRSGDLTLTRKMANHGGIHLLAGIAFLEARDGFWHQSRDDRLKKCARDSSLPGVWGVSPTGMCHCEPFSERSEAKARQSPLPEMATSPLAAGSPRHDRIGRNGGQSVKTEPCHSPWCVSWIPASAGMTDGARDSSLPAVWGYSGRMQCAPTSFRLHGAAGCCRGFGGVPQFPNLPPRMGARGLKRLMNCYNRKVATRRVSRNEFSEFEMWDS